MYPVISPISSLISRYSLISPYIQCFLNHLISLYPFLSPYVFYYLPYILSYLPISSFIFLHFCISLYSPNLPVKSLMSLYPLISHFLLFLSFPRFPSSYFSHSFFHSPPLSSPPPPLFFSKYRLVHDLCPCIVYSVYM